MENTVPEYQTFNLIEVWGGITAAWAAWQPIEEWAGAISDNSPWDNRSSENLLMPENEAGIDQESENQTPDGTTEEGYAQVEAWEGALSASVQWEVIENWVGTLFENQSPKTQVLVTFDRRLSGDRVGQHKVPPLSPVKITITVTVSSQVENAILADYFPNNWAVVDANEGTISRYNETHNKIEWNIESLSGSISKSYVIESPQATTLPTKYNFRSEIAYESGSVVSDEWAVWVEKSSAKGKSIRFSRLDKRILYADFRAQGLPLKGVKIAPTQDVGDAEAFVELLDGRPAGVPPIEGVAVYAYMEISTTVPKEDIAEAEIEFSIPKALVRAVRAVVAYHYNGSRWEALPTSEKGEDGDEVHFSARTSGFSIFAFTYVTDEIVYEGGTTGISGAQADDEVYENIYENDYDETSSLTYYFSTTTTSGFGTDYRAFSTSYGTVDTTTIWKDFDETAPFMNYLDPLTTRTITGGDGTPSPSALKGYGWRTSGVYGDVIPAGTWQFNLRWRSSSTTGTVYLQIWVYSCDSDGTNVTNLFSIKDTTYDITGAGTGTTYTYTYNSSSSFDLTNKVLVVEIWDNVVVKGANNATLTFEANSNTSSMIIPYAIHKYRENVQHNITGISASDNYELQIEYYTAGDSEPFSVYLYNFSTSGWDNVGNIQGGSAASPNLFTYGIAGTNYISGGEVRVRYVQPDNDSTQTCLMIDYARVKKVTYTWELIETWTGTVSAPASWKLVETWSGSVSAPVVWVLVETWTGSVSAPAQWSLIETWTGSVSAPVAWSLIETWSGTVIAPILPTKPVLYLPENGARTTDNTPYFEWIKGENADYHRIEVDNDPDFSSPIDNVNVYDNKWTKTPPGYSPGTYYWRVWAVNAYGENVSENTWQFKVILGYWNLIETWSGTVSAPANWRLVESWSGTVSSPAAWSTIETWSGTVSSPAEWREVEAWQGTVNAPASWKLMETWSGSVSAPVVWVLVETWSGSVSAPAQWVLAETWTGTVSSPAEWRFVEAWTGTASAPAYWSTIETWTGTITTTATWQLIESWVGTINAPAAWQSIESWTGTINSPATWSDIEIWTGTAQTLAIWQNVDSWTGSVSAPATWSMAELWTGTVTSHAAWLLIEAWSGAINAPASWRPIEAWSGTITAAAEWKITETWAGTVSTTAEWQVAEIWSSNLSAPSNWRSIESWTGSISTSATWRLTETWTGSVSSPFTWDLIESWTGTITSNMAPTSSVNAMPVYWLTNAPFTITASASDQDGTVISVTLWYRYSEDNSSWSNWKTFGTDNESPWSWSFNAPEGDGHYEFYSIARDDDNQEEAAKNLAEAKCGLDRLEPTIISVTINNGASVTSSLDVTINIVATDKTSGLSHMRFNSGAGWSEWENFAPTKSYRLPPGDGLKNVYVQVRDRAGLSSFASASILLETLPPPPMGAITVTIGTIIAEQTGSADFTRYAKYMTRVWITAKYTISNVRVDLVEHETKPAGIPAPSARACFYLDITTTADLRSIAEITIDFRVPRLWVIQNDIDDRTIRLLRLDGVWQELPTSIIGSDPIYLYYRAIAPSLSIFAAVGEPKAPAPPQVTPPYVTPSPGQVPQPEIPIIFYPMIGMAVVLSIFAVAHSLLKPPRFYVLKKLEREVKKPGVRQVGRPLPKPEEVYIGPPEEETLDRLKRIARKMQKKTKKEAERSGVGDGK